MSTTIFQRVTRISPRSSICIKRSFSLSQTRSFRITYQLANKSINMEQVKELAQKAMGGSAGSQGEVGHPLQFGSQTLTPT